MLVMLNMSTRYTRVTVLLLAGGGAAASSAAPAAAGLAAALAAGLAAGAAGSSASAAAAAAAGLAVAAATTMLHATGLPGTHDAFVLLLVEKDGGLLAGLAPVSTQAIHHAQINTANLAT
jgi:hypothetical protein